MIREVVSNELFTILMVIGFAFVALAKVYDTKRFRNFISLIGNSKYLIIHTKEQKFFDRFDAYLFANLIISLCIFIITCYRTFVDGAEFQTEFIIKLLVSISAFILIKVLLERLIGSLFEIEDITDNYIFQKISYINFVGLLLIPINLLFLFSFTPSKNLLIIILCLLAITQITGLIVSFKVHQNLLKKNLFYFILYLCALEIAPYIILYHFLQVIKVF